ncbi:MAG: tetratricopeptide repeat protein [Bacteroidia bacterium]|jgi:tetratricopeptide (TPR) repeat protein|nr:tetratricopeptide repeat protein [Bacteroidia bacterium]
MKTLKLKSLIGAAVIGLSAQAQTLNDGLKAFEFEKFEAARSIFSALVQKDAKDAESWFYLGQAYTNLYKDDSAAWAYNQGVLNNPKSGYNYIGLGELQLAQKNIPQAQAQFKIALDLVRGRDGIIKDAKTLRLVAEAMINTDNKLVDDASNYIQSALEVAPNDYEVLITAGELEIEKNKTNVGPAASIFEKAIDIQPKNPYAHTQLAAIWIRVRNSSTALASLDTALKLDPNYAPALKLKSELYYRSKRYEEAKKYYTRYLEQSEASTANQTRFVRILYNSKDYEEVVKIIPEIQKTDKSDKYMYRLLGYSYYEVADEKKDTNLIRPGIDALNTFLATIDPAKIIALDYEYLGKLYGKLKGKDSLALYNFKKALEIDPNKTELYREMGVLYNSIRKFDLAITSFETYIANTKKVTLVDYQRLGLSAYYGKQYAKSDSAYAKILEQQPTYADGYLWRGNNQQFLDPQAKDTLGYFYYNTYISMAESNTEKNKKNLLIAYDYMVTYFIQKDKPAESKIYLNKILTLDPENKRAKDILKQLSGGK